jgi:hypothetical protein
MARLAHRAGVGPSGSAGPSTWRRAVAGARVAAAGQRRPAQITTGALVLVVVLQGGGQIGSREEKRRGGSGRRIGKREEKNGGRRLDRETMGEERGRRRDRDLRSMRLLAVQLPIQGATEAGGGAGRGGWGMGQR